MRTAGVGFGLIILGRWVFPTEIMTNGLIATLKVAIGYAILMGALQILLLPVFRYISKADTHKFQMGEGLYPIAIFVSSIGGLYLAEYLIPDFSCSIIGKLIISLLVGAANIRALRRKARKDARNGGLKNLLLRLWYGKHRQNQQNGFPNNGFQQNGFQQNGFPNNGFQNPPQNEQWPMQQNNNQFWR